MGKKSMTKKQIIIKLYKDKFIDERVLWNLLGSRFKKSEIKLIKETILTRREKHKNVRLR